MSSRFSHSQIALYRSCPLRFFYRVDLGLERRDAGMESHHLVYGAAMHAALAHLYQNKYFDACIDPAALLREAQDEFLAAYPTQLDPLDRAKTRENGVKALEFYATHYAFEDLKWKVLQVEQVDYDADDWQLHLDLVVESERGEVYGVDHKIVGGKDSRYLPETFWRRYEIDSQVTQYTDQIRKKYGRCDGFYINAIAMRSLKRESGKDGGSYAEYSALNDNGEILKVRLGRQMFSRTPEQIEQEWASVEQAKDAITEARAKMSAYNATSHRAYGFNSSSCTYCEYRPVCAAGWSWERDRELIEIQYRRVCQAIIPTLCPYHPSSDINWEYVSCSYCQSTGLHPLAGHRCTLDLGHEGRCDRPPVGVSEELEVEVED